MATTMIGVAGDRSIQTNQKVIDMARNRFMGHLKSPLIDLEAEMLTGRKRKHRERLSEETPTRRCDSLDCMEMNMQR